VKNKWINKAEVQGYVFDHNLRERTSAKTGDNYISGELSVATSEDGTNVVKVYFGYVADSGIKADTYKLLQEIIQSGKTYQTDGRDAIKVRISGNIEVNDWVNRNGEMVSIRRLGGSFCNRHNGQNITKPAEFEAEFLANTAMFHEVEDGDDYYELKGYVFNYRNELVPTSFSVTSPAGIKAFEDMEITQNEPKLVHIWGKVKTNTIVTQKESNEDLAFGVPAVTTTEKTFTSWEVCSASKGEAFEEDGDSVPTMTVKGVSAITKDELQKLLADREEHLADVKKRYEERQSQGVTNVTPASSAEVPFGDDGFAF
jgi:hypothetical protein